MAFCPDCGKEIKDGAAFCGNCGKQLGVAASEKSKLNFNVPANDEVKNTVSKAFGSVKKYFSSVAVDYDCGLFKFAVMLFVAVLLGNSISWIILNYIPQIGTLFTYANHAFKYLICIIIGGVMALFLFKNNPKKAARKKSSAKYIFWLCAVMLSVIQFIGHATYKYVLYGTVAINIIEILFAVSTLLLLSCRNKRPFVIIVSLLTLCVTEASIPSINLTKALHVLDSGSMLDFLTSSTFGLFALVILSFLLRYLLPEKISKFAIALLAAGFMAINVFDNISSFSLFDVFYWVDDLLLVLIVAFFCLACRRKNDEDEPKTEEIVKKIRPLKVGIISVVAVVVVVFAYMLTSAIISSTYINDNLANWKSKVASYTDAKPSQWSKLEDDISKYRPTDWAKSFIENYNDYDIINREITTMQTIAKCYESYKNGSFSSQKIESYNILYLGSEWQTNHILRPYYNMYSEMKPTIEKVEMEYSINLSSKDVTITVRNNNVLPIDKCEVQIDFSIGYIDGGYYSDTEYGRGSKTYVIETIPGKDSVTQSFTIDPDDYYDSYGSYMMSFLWDSSGKILSIE